MSLSEVAMTGIKTILDFGQNFKKHNLINFHSWNVYGDFFPCDPDLVLYKCTAFFIECIAQLTIIFTAYLNTTHTNHSSLLYVFAPSIPSHFHAVSLHHWYHPIFMLCLCTIYIPSHLHAVSLHHPIFVLCLCTTYTIPSSCCVFAPFMQSQFYAFLCNLTHTNFMSCLWTIWTIPSSFCVLSPLTTILHHALSFNYLNHPLYWL